VERLLEIRDLTVGFRAGGGVRAAVRGVSLTVGAGESVGVVGESGSGKSALALSVLRLLPDTAVVGGEILWEGRDLLRAAVRELRAMRGRDVAMIFQEPMTALNPVMRVGEQVAEAIRAHHPEMSRGELRRRVVDALREVAIEEPERRGREYPHQFSGGQRQRILTAMAIANQPRLLIADEPTTALDVTVQAQVLELIAELRRRHGLALLFISHDLAVVAQVAERVVVMRAGEIVEEGPVAEVLQRPQHEYTRQLLAASPSMRTNRGRPLASLA